MDKEGNTTLKSVDGYAELVLLSSGFQFKLVFLALLPNKKPQWQELSQMKASCSGSEYGRQEKRMRMVYEYVRLE